MTRDAEHTPSPQSVVVPIEPTREMLNAAVDATDAGSGMSWSNRSPQSLFDVAYRAMLAAAPASLAGGEGMNRLIGMLECVSGPTASVRIYEIEARMLLAALSPEAREGVEWFGVTGAADETEALAVALFGARCPGIRMTDEDLHYYRAAAQRAMQAVADELDTPALTPRHEAPADPCASHRSMGFHIDPCCPHCEAPASKNDYAAPKTITEAPAEGAGEREEIAREVWIGFTGNPNAWDRAKNTANETVKYCWSSADAIIDLRARSSAPEAREEALGNLLAVIHGDGGHRALEVGTKQAALEAEKIVAGLFAAPSADKLRIDLWWNAEDWETTFDNLEDAYEAATGGYCVGVARLGRATEHDAVWAACIDCDTTGDGEADDREIRLFATEDEARQALAALKAEGGK